MAKKKYDLITELYASAVKEVTAKPEHWMSFLRSASRNFRLPFDEQLLVHVQRPKATAVLEMEVWNRKFGRWVKRGSKGIAVFDKSSPVMRLKYYYDVSETQEGRYQRLVRPVPLWTVDDKNREKVRETLANTFGVSEGVEGFAETIQEAAKNAAEDNLPDYLQDILSYRKNSGLEDADEQSVGTEAEQLLKDSIAYMMMTRCGVDMSEHPGAESFDSITKFNTPELVNLFGVAVSDVAEMALAEISDTIQKLQLEEKKKKRTFAGQEAGRYTGLETPENRQERSLTYDEDRIQQAGRLPSAKLNRTPRAGGTPWEIWISAPKVSEGTPIRNLSEPADTGEIEQPPSGSAGNSTKQERADDGGNGKGAERDRGAESTGSAFVGAEDEQHLSGGGGDRDERGSVQLIQKETTQEIETKKESAEEKPSAFSFSQELIDTFLRTVDDKENIKYRIYSYFQRHPTSQKKAEYLKRVYGVARAYSDTSGMEIELITDAEGMKLSSGENKITLKWERVAKRIDDLIAVESYLSERELKNMPEYEMKVLCAEIYYFYKKQPKEVMRPYPSDTDYHAGVKLIREHLEDPEVVGYFLESVERVLSSTAETDKNYKFIRKVHQDLLDYRDGVYGLLSHIPAEKEHAPSMELEEPESRESVLEAEPKKNQESISEAELEQEQIEAPDTQTEQNQEELSEPEPIQNQGSSPELVMEQDDKESQEPEQSIEEVSVSKADAPAYDLHPDTVVSIGMEEYEIQFLSDEMVVLHDLTYPLFTKEMTREEFDRKLRENPANDHLRQSKSLEETSGQTDIPSLEPATKVPTEISAGELSKLPAESKNGGPSAAVFEDLPAEEEIPFDLSPAWEKAETLPRKVQAFDLHPEIPQAKRSQYHITNDDLGHGTPKEKFRANIAAIQLLKKCETENRFATPDEQEILSGYVGWGSLSDAFDETKSSWSTEYLELKTVLTEEEYTAARESTLTAFYTPPVVIRSMYQALENMGLKSGNILEPSCGTGNFIGMKPESMAGCKIYGVELDRLSGRIAGQLYQKSAIAIQGFETAELPDSFFDAAVGNVPFGQFKLSDKRYDKNNFLVHDYFFAKTLDKVRPGGVIAFITSSGTMDKKNPAVRKYIAQRAELLGAIRLPNDTFQKNAGTSVTADILFLQKRDRMIETEPDWIGLDTDENGITQNRYFVEHPEMVLGEMVLESTQYGMDSTCRPYPDRDLESLFLDAIGSIQAEISEYEAGELVEAEDNSIPADPSIANFSYALFEGNIYYRENSRMRPVELSVTAANRVRGMIAIRDCVRELIEYQTEDYPDSAIEEQQRKLNRLYDAFRKKYGLLNSRGNSMAFSDDNSYPLLCSLEILGADGKLERKADMFTKRTIKPHRAVEKVDTASEALSLSLAEKGRVDMDYMCSLTGKSMEVIEKELSGVIFRLPEMEEGEPCFVSEDEYLSGNVRKKLKAAKRAAEKSELFQINVEALEKVQPKDLTASEISVRLGATWIPETDVQEFLYELLEVPKYQRWHIKVHFFQLTGEWNIEGKKADKGNVKAESAYGTKRASAYKIIEDTLNLRDTRVYDYVDVEGGKKKAILNKKETAIAQGKQDLIKQAFQDWIWKDTERRQRLTEVYNESFNAIRTREYDGSHLKFYGMNPEIKLREHQINGAARIIYGGNTLLAYVVGAGKTYTMVAAAMESKRLGLCSKSMVVVPNHIIEQFAAEWLQLYPSANLLVATKKDFETKNRKKFCARIATSDVDAVIIGHSQFEKIPLSPIRQRMMLEEQLDEILDGIAEAKQKGGDRLTIKQMEKSKKTLSTKLDKLNDQSGKDDVVCFEELGIDRLFVDEADSYKNLFLYTKMRNVAGIAQTEAQKSSDMFMKCRYLDELTGAKGVVFATGTPISNSMTELYTMQRYLQYHVLEEHHLQHFDAWASTFGETVSAIELAPEGRGYRMKTRFAKFYNLPELMRMFKEVADIQTADMLSLPVPEVEYRTVPVEPSEIQEDMVAGLGERAEKVRNGMIDPTKDNMLLITNDGRRLALDQRLVNEMLPDEKVSKINACVDEVYRFWEEGKEDKLTQLVFCDLSTPKKDGSFSVYNDVRDKLIGKGIPPEEIVFIHDANTEVRKKELFAKVRKGTIRVLMGSTFKMGAGTNVQDRIIASHDLDCPWRPRDLEQRAGRTIRQGNRNKKVHILRYVTKGTFDAYLYQVIENKQKFISQIMTSKSPARSVEDIDEAALSYAEIKALATGNPYIKEKMELDIEVSKLQLMKQSFLSEKYRLEDQVTRYYPAEIKWQETLIRQYEADTAQVKEHTPESRDVFPAMEIKGIQYKDKEEAGEAVLSACNAMTSPKRIPIGTYRGLSMELGYNALEKDFEIFLIGEGSYWVILGGDARGNITRIDNRIERLADDLSGCRNKLEEVKVQLEHAKIEAAKEFPQEEELNEKTARLGELNALLDLDKEEHVELDGEPEETETEPEKKREEMER